MNKRLLKTALYPVNYFLCIHRIEGGFGPAITTQDLKEAVEGFTPVALRGVKLHTAGELGWCDVGGLSAVKGTLMETLLWPTKVLTDYKVH